ncbi:glycogen debranching N-terminal domain-containing protein [Cyanobacterium sp. IPPAS B-1200]|uniref:amylo-alpha-1,6-glucosidase n=1 Tax=Cyanobacterium sp. IPPAS B-1200 TaxID=1562720 RepID=UPI0008525487|nr:glycogen debranching N-terminal domain-containing protein [Cyanobacterium sp. IPPAS B-1200]OEJ79677.1 amylo-alpha-1,6-glucosidase [Cyanobacterium sp. IPPAS B-1200]
MAQKTYQLYGKNFLPALDNELSELPYAVDFQSQPTLVIKDNDLFLITDTLGNTVAYADTQKYTVTGLFCRDTRFLSRSELQIEGVSPVLLGSCAETGYSIIVDSTNPTIKGVLKPGAVGIKRKIALRGALWEEIELRNYSTSPLEFEVSLSFQADFKDLFKIRNYDRRSHRGRHLKQLSIEDNYLSFAYQGLDNSLAESLINFCHHPPDYIKGNTVVWHVKIDSQEVFQFGYYLQTKMNDQPSSYVALPESYQGAIKEAKREEEEWYQGITKIRTDSTVINNIIEQAQEDIYLLLQSFGFGKVLVAGIPWFSTLFGRDSLIAARQTLMFDSRIARDTLLTLAHFQGSENNDWRDESPGKILHELRLGELARCDEIPHTPYYGSVDATPLWLILLADYFHRTGDRDILDKLWSNAIAAMNWIDDQSKKTGYLTYLCRSSRGIQNQGWKDSGDCIVNSRGELVEGAIALCEVQGYVYGAKIRMSEMASIIGDLSLAQKWKTEAEELKERFNRDFWLESENYCALGLDETGNPIDSITSNPGHCLLWDIFTHEKARAVGDRLCKPDLFSGWGIRTLSSLSPAYNPMGYHLGSVWPHDSAIIAQGLHHIGMVDQALIVTEGLIAMTSLQPNNRPSELFCGFSRQENHTPVKYPVACLPQAWATGVIFQLLEIIDNGQLNISVPY